MPTQSKKKAAKPKKVVKPKAPAKKKPALECGVCGYRIVVDEACGCAEEHVLVCCGQPMKRRKPSFHHASENLAPTPSNISGAV